jgi:hypothetical protein
MKIPDFFIIGAPKCGTTALSEYLGQHPNICFSHVKEPHFFSDDIPSYKIDRTLADYLRRNFSHFDARRHRAMGEGSVFYYFSDVAVPNILDANPSARFVYAVRNPVDMVYSLYSQYCYSYMEDIGSFEDAWNAQQQRAAGCNIPRRCYEPHFLQYRTMGLLGQRLKALKSIIPAGQLLVVAFDDLVSNPRQVYEDVLAFLGVPTDGRSMFPVVNENKVRRSRALGYLSTSVPRWLHNGIRDLKHAAGISHVPLNILARISEKPAKRPPLSEAFRKHLVAEFERDVCLLEQQLGRHFDQWRN